VTTPLRARFLLDPDVCYLNHGAFGAAPIPVFEAYQAWQRELERQPTRTLEPALAEARRELAAYVGAGEDDLTFVPNATTGVNVVARSIRLAPGDEILSCDHEYGACDLAWRAACQAAGAGPSFAGYNGPEDLERLLDALAAEVVFPASEEGAVGAT
jgi:isopenicillin-N epimerase